MIEDKEQTITGVVENITFHNSGNGFSVLELNSYGELITAVGTTAELCEGVELTLKGKTVNDPNFGPQFRFTEYTLSMPDSAAKMMRFLSGGAIRGIGPKTAARIIDAFGDDTADILENHPERLAEIKGISVAKAIAIGTDFKKNFAVRKMLIELESYGISPSECTEIYKIYGPNSISVVRCNPYIISEILPSFTFERADNLCSAMGIPPQEKDRNRAFIYYVLRHNTRANGHSCLPVSKLEKTVCDYLGIDHEAFSSALIDLSDSKKTVIAEYGTETYAYTTELYIAEMTIAERLKFILRFPPSYMEISDNYISVLEQKNGIEYAEKQKQAIITAVRKGLLVLTGGPGTGKTTTVRGIIDVFENNGISVDLCAPTGRAAKRLSEITRREAKTIHRLLEFEFDSSEHASFGRNRQNPLDAGAIIIDEMSMVDTELCAALLDAVPLGCRVIIVGDSDQLSSVGPGNVLNDILHSGMIPIVCLTEIFRQAQESLIVMNAHSLIKNGEMNLSSTKSDFFMLKRSFPSEVRETVASLVCDRLKKAYSYDPFNDIQVLCPSKNGECGTKNLNIRLQAILNPASRKKVEIKGPFGHIFREGDKVMQTKNNYSIIWKRENDEGEGIFNGDIGIIEKISVAGAYLQILFDDRRVEYPVEDLKDLDLAYAVTIHKSQGSEYPAVIIPIIDCAPQLMYRNLLYTGITRAKKLLILCGSETKVMQMAADMKNNRRYSGLTALLQ